jgi:filamentous hemagglutinin family protein
MKNTAEYTNHFRILKGGKISLVVSALLGTTTLVFASPTGGVVTSGSATIANIGKTTNITQATQKASINWNQFNISHDEIVNFKQPNVSSITLNRVIGNEKSIINGALNANGQVWILNSNGVLFGKNAKINTAGLLASTKELSDIDFQAGNYHFKGTSTASVINLGEIDISNSGYATLLANTVSNDGTIRAVRGSVRLVGAEEVTINLNGNSIVDLIVNKGVLDALVENRGAVYADGGEIYLTTNAVNELLKGVVNNTGIIEANSLDGITGYVELFAHGGTTQVDGTISAHDGFVETSGDKVKIDDSFRVTADKWLIDPTDFTIATSGGDSSGATISTNLATADIEIKSVNGANGTKGDIHVNDIISWNSDKTLKLNAQNDIFINKEITSTNANGKLELIYGQKAAAAENTADYHINAKVNLKAGENFITKLGSDGTATTWTVLTEATTMQAMTLKNTNVRYVLGTDLSLTGTNNWTPIGDYPTNNFTGKFDGLGHTISNLKINNTGRDNVGLFGYINGATIKNIGVVDVAITGGWYVGGLVGHSNGSTIENSYATGAVSGTFIVGGLVGNNVTSTITNSYATGAVTGTGTDESVGGLVGSNARSIIENSYATGAVSGAAHVGGLVGDTVNSTITSSYATGEVSGTKNVGGLIGSNVGGNVGNSSTIKNSYATGKVTGTGEYVGGLVGSHRAVDSGTSTINNAYATGVVTGTTKGGLVGIITASGGTATATITNSFYDKTKNSAGMSDVALSGVTGLTTKEMSYGGIYKTVTWDIVADSIVTSTTPIIKYDGTKYVWAIAPLDLSYTLSNQSKTYDGETKNLSDLYTNVFGADYAFITSGYKFQVSGTDVIGYKNAGTYENIKVLSDNDFLTIKTAGNTDGKYVINKATISAITGITAQDKTYDGTTTASLVTSSADFADIISGDVLSVATAIGIFEDKEIGTDITVDISGLTLGGDDALNYNLITTTATTKANITPVPVTTPDVAQKEIKKVISAITNQSATKVAVPDLKRVATTSTPMIRRANTAFSVGENSSVVSNPTDEQSTKRISLSEAREMHAKALGVDNVPEVRVPLSRYSQIVLINGGVNLPKGVEQEFYIEDDSK